MLEHPYTSEYEFSRQIVSPQSWEAFDRQKHHEAFLHAMPEVWIELGPGPSPQYREALARGATTYVGVEVHRASEVTRTMRDEGAPHTASIFDGDIVSYLKTVPDESAFVFSFGVLGLEHYEDKELGQRYLSDVWSQIVRVTPRGGATFHWAIDRRFRSRLLIPIEADCGLFQRPY
jgi:hypothetical protein